MYFFTIICLFVVLIRHAVHGIKTGGGVLRGGGGPAQLAFVDHIIDAGGPIIAQGLYNR